MKRNQSDKKKYSQQIGDYQKSIGLFFFLSSCFLTQLSFALEALDDKALSQISGQEGISMMLSNVSLSGSHTITYNASPTESLTINNLVIDNATSSTAATGGADAGSVTNPLTLDIDPNNGLEIAMPAAASGTMDNFHLGIGELWVNAFLLGGVDIYGLDLEGTRIAIKANRYSAAPALMETVIVQCDDWVGDGDCEPGGFFTPSGNPVTADFVRRPELFNSNIEISVALKADIEQLKVTPATGTGAMEINGLTIDDGAGGAWNLGTVAVDFGSGYDVGAANNFGSQFDSNGNLATRLGPGMFVSISGGGVGNVRINNVVWQETANFSNQLNPGTPVNMGAVQIDGLQLIKLDMRL